MPGEDTGPDYVVYVLELENECYYVGKAQGDGDRRIRAHFRGAGAEWTQEHPPIEVELREEAPSDEAAKKREQQLLSEYVDRYGESRVRGAGFTDTGGSS